jgi:lysophospholipase L1-like esterase
LKLTRKWGVVVLTTLLAAALAADVLFAFVTIEYVHASEAIRLDPAGLDIYADARSHAPASAGEGPPIVEFFGDSRAFMWSEPPPIPGYRLVNRGIGRQTTAQMLLRFDADVTATHPAVVVFEGGVNDLKTIAEFPERRATIVSECKANLATIVGRIQQAGARVVLVTVFDIGDVPLWRRPFWSQDVEAAVREVNAYLPQLAGDKVVLFDANSALEDPPGTIRHEFQLDHLHLTPAAYAALNERLVPLVAGLPR